jgi:hypothetical protein
MLIFKNVKKKIFSSSISPDSFHLLANRKKKIFETVSPASRRSVSMVFDDLGFGISRQVSPNASQSKKRAHPTHNNKLIFRARLRIFFLNRSETKRDKPS